MNLTHPNHLSRGLIHLWLLLGFGLLVVSFFLYQEWRLTGALAGVPLDDSWIHFRFSHNLRSGDGFSFNPGVPTPGSTSPLWVVLLSLVGSGFLMPSKIIGVLAWLALGVVVYQLSGKAGLSSPYALLAGLSTLAAGRLAWSAPSGMETSTFALFTLAFFWSWADSAAGEIKPYASLLLGLACLLRPEGYLLLLLSGIAWLLVLWGKHSWGNILRLLARHFLIAGLVIMPYFLFSYYATGNLLPNTFYAKTGAWDCRPSLLYFGWISAVFFLDNPLMAIFAVVGLAGLIRSHSWRSQAWFALAGLWLLALPIIYGFVAPCISGYFTRYTAPLIPVFMVIGAFGAKRVGDWYQIRRRASTGTSPRVPLMLSILIQGLLISLIPTTLFWGPYYGQSVADLETMHVSIANWVLENTDPSDVIAVNDIGAIGFISDREVIDLMGLVNPETLPYVSGKVPGEWDRALAGYLKVERPGYLIIFPNWFPTMVDYLPAEELLRVTLGSRQFAGIPNITVLGGGEMVVYRLDW
jgi:hypothetical protein